MSTTGIDALDTSMQTTHVWLKAIMAKLGPDRHFAWHVLGAVLQTLRNRLQLDLGAHLSAQLPLVVRGLYYDHFEPSRIPSSLHSEQEFLEEISTRLAGGRGVDPHLATITVFEVLVEHLSPGLIGNVRHALPKGIARLMPEPVAT